MGAQKKMSLSLSGLIHEFELNIQTQNLPKMSHSTQNEVLNSMVRLKTH